MKPLIVANWKMNPVSLAEAKRLFSRVKNLGAVICPPYTYLSCFSRGRRKCLLGSQDCFWENTGAYTGAVSPLMLRNLGVKYVILGHSERRKHLKESDEMVNKKMKIALSAGLKPILCIANLAQLKRSLKGITEKIVIAYEPVFAIGTGKPCSIKKAKQMKGLIQKKTKKDTLILYGGSVNSQNAGSYIKKAGFNGLLVGGTSLKAKEFIDIVKAACYSK